MTSERIPLEQNDLKELLIKNWMTHDAMWFYHGLLECGIEPTNRINQGAVKAMAAIEIKRLQKALGAGKPDTFDEFKQFFEAVMGIATGKFMKYSYSLPEPNRMRCQWESCFAYEGVTALGVIEQYQCGIMLRIETWFDTLGIKYEVEPNVTGCMMQTDGRCFRDYRFFFAK
ncbi:MAG: hypothetical protein C0407_13100 [Desulfobacca sp.]|nr:hypothetical protein [Desulfobacca sp.]